jgi:methyl-accepting chemotaxis protein
MKNMKISWKLALGFGITIVLMIVGGVFSGNTASELSGMTHKLYKHPLAVATSIRDVETSLVAIHRGMKDVAMANSIEQVERNKAKVDTYVDKAMAAFVVLDERFLGDKADIRNAEKLFRDWAPIREKVIRQTVIDLENDAAEITKGEGAQHVGKLMAAVTKLSDFASGKADEFHAKARNADASQTAGLIDKFYRHPFTVTQKTLEVRGDIFSMVRMMKDVALAESLEQVEQLSAQVDRAHREALTDMDVIDERFLGDKAMVNNLRQLFAGWKPIRDKVIGMRNAQLAADPGRITREEGAPHLARLITVLDKIKAFADNKAVSFNANATKQADNAITLLLVVFSLAAIIAVTMAYFITRSITQPIAKGVGLAEEIAKGDFNMRLNLERRDEVGILAKTLDAMADNLQRNAQVAEQISEGNLDVQVTLASDKDQLGGALQKMTDNLNEILGQLQVSGEQIGSGSIQVSDSSQTLSQGATKQASSLEEISASLNEMSSQTSTNAENANQANTLSAEAQKAARKGSGQMETMIEAMGEINEAGQNISKIIKTIDEIAFQTNLLALNAAVEAARAGQHGKGFAVVAEEVRNLAARSAKAASETAELIEGSVEKTERGTQIADQTAEALSGIVGDVSKVTDLVAEIAAASNEQAQGIAQINTGVTQVDQVTQQNTASAEEGAAAAEELSGQAEQMRGMLQRFNLRQGQKFQSAPSRISDSSAANIGWKEMGSGNSEASEDSLAPAQIALDDSDFGKY